MSTLYSTLWLILCILLQVLVFNHLHVCGGVVLIYLIGLIKFPFETNRSLQILIGFICGLIIDIFSNTLGMHALTCVMIMWLRLPLLHMFILADETKTGIASFSRIGTTTYIRFLLTIVLVHSIILYFVESFTLFNLLPMLLKVLFTSLLTIAFAVSIELLSLTVRK